MRLHQSLGEAALEPDLGTEFLRVTRALREKRYPRGEVNIQEVVVDGRLRFKVDVGDRLGADVYFGAYRELLGIEALCRVLTPNDTVVDVGANFGFVSISAASRLGPKGRVVAFEPDDCAHALLIENLKLNQLGRRVKVCKYCLGNEDRLVPFHPMQESAFSGLADTGRATAREVVTVQEHRLDTVATELRLRSIDLLKIDVEGFEYAVLEGAAGILGLSADPLIYFEASVKNLGDGRRDHLQRVLAEWIAGSWEAWVYDMEQNALVQVASPEAVIDTSPGNVFFVKAGSQRLQRLQAAYRDIVASRLLPTAIKKWIGSAPADTGDDAASPHSLQRLLWSSFLTEFGAHLQQDRAAAREEAGRLRAQLATLESALVHEREARAATLQRAENAATEAARVAERIEQAQAEIRHRAAELESSQRALIAAEQAAAQAGVRETRLLQECDRLKQMAAADNQRLEQLTPELERVRIERDGFRAELKRLETSIAEGEAALERTQHAKEARDIEFHEGQRSLAVLRAEADRLRGEAVGSESERKALEEACDATKAGLEQSRTAQTAAAQEAERLRAQQVRVVQDCDRLNQLAATYSRQLEQLKPEMERLRSERDRLCVDLGAKDVLVAERATELASVRKSLDTSEAKRQAVQRELDRLCAEVEQRTKGVSALAEERQAAVAALAEARQQMAKLEHDRRDLHLIINQRDAARIAAEQELAIERKRFEADREVGAQALAQAMLLHAAERAQAEQELSAVRAALLQERELAERVKAQAAAQHAAEIGALKQVAETARAEQEGARQLAERVRAEVAAQHLAEKRGLDESAATLRLELEAVRERAGELERAKAETVAQRVAEKREWEESTATLQLELETVRGRNGELERTLEEMRAIIGRQKAERIQMAEQLAAECCEVENLRADSEKSRQAAEARQVLDDQALKAAEARRQELEEALSATREILEQARWHLAKKEQRADELQALLDQRDSAVATLRGELTDTRTQADSLATKLGLAREEHSRVIAEQSRLGDELRQFIERQEKKLKDERDAFATWRLQAEQRQADSAAEKAVLDATLAAARAEVVALRGQLADLGGQREQLQAALDATLGRKVQRWLRRPRDPEPKSRGTAE